MTIKTSRKEMFLKIVRFLESQHPKQPGFLNGKLDRFVPYFDNLDAALNNMREIVKLLDEEGPSPYCNQEVTLK